MRYLVDSDWIADYLVGKQEAVALLDRLVSDGIGVSLITLGEIYEGIYYGRDPKQSEAGFHQFLAGVRVLPLTRPIVQRFARIRGDLRRRGLLIGDPDLFIAATALHHGLILVTRNRRHFDRIPDLKLYDHACPHSR
jgi:tRNA(fMet)-specific endonuclease VapC